ncbi:hypothetical protein [Enterobacteria phage vB_EcoM_IME281]|uniref:RIIA lysis inhibitor n=1 Tax=Enterobacteria phage vB_EcoM_IME281 TaxID=2163887 RepID=A0A2S1GNQ1_9CAUD|nr:hypothetical protein KNT84_gp001 [Enterobacteria phage vB_EcoM_IME281]AWD91011.1 hypothetical protein [Enterobacteria phage vB_EcoM_IME281]
MTNFKVNIDLFDKAAHKEFRLIQRFFDINAAEDFKERFKEIRYKILNDIATKEELLEVADIFKRNLN